MKIRPVGAEFHANGRTDGRRKLIVAFRSFANAAKNDGEAVCKFFYQLLWAESRTDTTRVIQNDWLTDWQTDRQTGFLHFPLSVNNSCTPLICTSLLKVVSLAVVFLFSSAFPPPPTPLFLRIVFKYWQPVSSVNTGCLCPPMFMLEWLNCMVWLKR
jgi:hypothetical protein